ncbi:Rhodanese-like domain protein [invertebrate metagenome]|uniref:Rhodanese-like domain protein n=1 Tax=invertebrate metagenome TaxID=1711999 RepID=A0A484H6K3_9ZZZZ
MINNIEVEELSTWLYASEAPILLDVREPWEISICSLKNSLFIPMGQVLSRAQEIPSDQRVVAICHHGIRSHHVVEWLRRLGYENVVNLRGGIDAWARRIDPQMTLY